MLLTHLELLQSTQMAQTTSTEPANKKHKKPDDETPTNFVVAVGAEGWFHLFDLSVSPAKSESTNHQEVLFGEDQKPSFTQHIPANTKVILISDIGECRITKELVRGNL
ncbi:Integrin-alpha FG-GAP repeat-containing protein 2 [Acipenser ruthenus]|uniref:Integrin-alpha FG-GAP repeat-containing protein 2 n=1 Tax=Acipenser ruthenus TaxID=7906 RepID=A0A662YXQ2_ACIRT|nr:Integrin-alpha FG-GAP repeat-containing protein 2 [Acipenser ruthenus]